MSAPRLLGGWMACLDPLTFFMIGWSQSRAIPPAMDNTIKQAWAELKKLPRDEQEIAAAAILDYAAGAGRPRLTEDQIAEVARRLTDPSPTFATLAEVRARFRRPAS